MTSHFNTQNNNNIIILSNWILLFVYYYYTEIDDFLSLILLMIKKKYVFDMLQDNTAATQTFNTVKTFITTYKRLYNQLVQ